MFQSAWMKGREEFKNLTSNRRDSTMRRNSIFAIAMALAVALVGAGQPFGLGTSLGFIGPGFDKPSIPAGARLVGPAGKGAITLTVIGGASTATFVGRCGNTPVDTGAIDVSIINNAAGFPTATEKAIADSVEGWYLTVFAFPQLAAFTPCYGADFLGVYVTAVNKSISKTPTVWVGEATIQGVRF
jgi:hypothetical protein